MFGRVDQAIAIGIKGNISKIKNMDMEFLYGKMVISIKASLSRI